MRPVDCSPPGFPVHGIFQARVPEWGAIALSEGILEKWFIPEPGLEKYQMSLAQLVVPEHKEVFPKGWGHVRTTQKPTRRRT